LFFVLLGIAALTSTVSMLEVVVAYFSEELNLTRKKATFISSLAISIVGIFATLSFGPLREFQILNKSIFDWLDYLSISILLPLGAILIVLFVGWYLGKKNVIDEIGNSGTLKLKMIGIFMFIIKFLAPIAIAAVFIYGLGLISP